MFLTPQYLAIAMEFVAGGDMFEFVVSKKGLKESEARCLHFATAVPPVELGSANTEWVFINTECCVARNLVKALG